MRLTRVALLVLSLVLLSCSQTPRPGEQIATGSILIEVVDIEDGRRIGPVSVHLVRIDGSEAGVRASHTMNVPAGSYTVKVSAAGYAPR